MLLFCNIMPVFNVEKEDLTKLNLDSSETIKCKN